MTQFEFHEGGLAPFVLYDAFNSSGQALNPWHYMRDGDKYYRNNLRSFYAD